MSNDLAILEDIISGHGPTELAYGGASPLVQEDLDALASGGTHSYTPTLKTLRHAHHQLARVLARGAKLELASSITGYSISRISILRGDPAFRDLVSYYEQQEDAVDIDVRRRLSEFGLSCLDELQERLESAPDSFNNAELRKLFLESIDRAGVASGPRPSGAGGGQTNIINVTFEESQHENSGPIINHEPSGGG